MSSAGREVIDLCKLAGLDLDPWQAQIIVESLGETRERRWSAPRVGVIVGRQNGKGAIIEARELAGLFLFGERMIIHSAHRFQTSLEGFMRIAALVDGCADLRREVKTIKNSHGEEGIVLKSGARLRFMARTTASARGFSADCMILDEAYALTDEQMAAILPTMAARPNPQCWFVSTPPLEPTAYLMKVRAAGERASPGLAYFDYGVDADADADDPAVWRAANPSMAVGRISEAHVAMERDTLPDIEFRRERLGIWPTVAADVPIDAAQWELCREDASRRAGKVALAIDVSPRRDTAAIAVYGVRGDGLGHVELADYRPGTEWLVPRVAEIVARHQPVAIALDPAGPAGSFAVPLLKSGVKPSTADLSGGELAQPTGREYAQACGAFVDAVRDRQIRHIGQPELSRAVDAGRTRPLGDAWAWARRNAASDISPLVAATLARWAYESRAHLLTAGFNAWDHVY